MTECNHDLAERETMCADGWCPICLQTALVAADKQLATEREKREHDVGILMNQRTERDATIQQLRSQLAAERAKVLRPMIFDPEHYPEYRIVQLEQQLATDDVQAEAYVRRIQELNQQLADSQRKHGMALDALAVEGAEREKYAEAEKQWKDWQFRATDLKDALNAEREKTEEAYEIGNAAIKVERDENKLLSSQLAAAQALCKSYVPAHSSLQAGTSYLDAAIAEATKPLVDALKLIAELSSMRDSFEATAIARNALAAVKEGKQ